jgi:diaminopimelate epimerase
MLKFTKMHGLGNDFVVFDAINQAIALSPEQIRRIADRHFGIGCDQVLLVEAPSSSDADFRYRIFNADGGEVTQCGNGARCFARYVRDKGLSDKNAIRVDTGPGQLLLRFDGPADVTVDMGIPRHAPEEIPLRAAEERLDYSLTIDGRTWHFGAVSIGNPHAVLRVNAVETAPIDEIGPCLESHADFPERANIGFMEVVDRHHVRLRVFERGAGETLACGSGACAAAVVGIEQGHLDDPVQVELLGGALVVSWQGRGRSVVLTGPAVSVFDGEIDL